MLGVAASWSTGYLARFLMPDREGRSARSGRKINLRCVRSKPNRSRIWFSRYRWYEKWSSLGSLTENTKVGGLTPTCRTRRMRNRLRMLPRCDGGVWVDTASASRYCRSRNGTRFLTLLPERQGSIQQFLNPLSR